MRTRPSPPAGTSLPANQGRTLRVQRGREHGKETALQDRFVDAAHPSRVVFGAGALNNVLADEIAAEDAAQGLYDPIDRLGGARPQS